VLAERLPGDGVKGEEDLMKYATGPARRINHPSHLRDGLGRECRHDARSEVRGMDGLRVVDAS